MFVNTNLETLGTPIAMMIFLYTQYGPRIAWIMEGGVILLTVSLWVIFYRRMVPLKITTDTESPRKGEEKEEDSSNESHTEPQAIPRLDLLPDDLKFIFASSK
uniref:Uncharacterized protein n=1 Tax=Acrobeloides nanus TaxID=290746 RepID=A0A914CGY5_9BILA